MDLAPPMATVMRGGVAIGQAAHAAVLCGPRVQRIEAPTQHRAC